MKKHGVLTVDQIYEAALVPELWSSVLHDLAQSVGAAGTLMFASKGGVRKSIVSKGIIDVVQRFVTHGWADRNVRAQRLEALSPEGFVNDFDLFPNETIEDIPLYRDFLIPNGFGWGAACTHEFTNGDQIVFSIEKKLSDGPIDKKALEFLNSLRQHLNRAALMSAQLEFEKMRAATEALSLMGLPALVVGYDGRVLSANDRALSSKTQLSIGAQDRLTFQSEAANLAFRSIFQNKGIDGTVIFGDRLSFPLPSGDDLFPGIAHVVPVKGSARDIFLNAACFIILTSTKKTQAPQPEFLQVIFNLSPAEARVAKLLVDGNTVRAISRLLTISPETVRSHVKAILSKSKVNRQVDFVAAVTRLNTHPF